MAKFVVDRRTWFRGEGSENSKLLREDGKRCCIGFVGQQCGISDDALAHRADIETRHKEVEPWPEWMTRFEHYDIAEAYRTNDKIAMTDEERETELKAIFARNGDEIEFIN